MKIFNIIEDYILTISAKTTTKYILDGCNKFKYERDGLTDTLEYKLYTFRMNVLYLKHLILRKMWIISLKLKIESDEKA